LHRPGGSFEAPTSYSIRIAEWEISNRISLANAAT
jgi:hypothetical protein